VDLFTGEFNGACNPVVGDSCPRIVPTSLNVITVPATTYQIAKERPMTDAGPLHQEHPVEYPAGTPPLAEDQAQALAIHLDQGWQRDGVRRLSREFTFGDFRDAFGFATRVALLAEREFHHPELTVTWGKVLVTLWTHTVNGLSRNDFIIAARIDRLTATTPAR
jgi:4a-hydroxytetrahydrobiopterin dehydratase